MPAAVLGFVRLHDAGASRARSCTKVDVAIVSVVIGVVVRIFSVLRCITVRVTDAHVRVLREIVSIVGADVLTRVVTCVL
jgi:hypothetical protein